MRKLTRTAWMPAVILALAGLSVPGLSRAERGCFPPVYREPYLVNQLRYAWDEDDREDAAEELGTIGDPRALPALSEAAACDPEKDVRKEARKAIKRIERRRHKGCGRAGHPAGCCRPFPQYPAVYQPRAFYFGTWWARGGRW